MFSGLFAGHERLSEMVSMANRSLELVGDRFAAVKGVNAEQAAPTAFCAWSLLDEIAMLDQNGILSETTEEQEALGVRGILALAKDFDRILVTLAME